MNIIFSTISRINNANYNRDYKTPTYNSIKSKNNESDTFVKNNISFKGTDTKSNKSDIAKDLASIGLAGGTYLLTLAAAIYAANKIMPDEIFKKGDTSIINPDEKSIIAGKIIADGDDGIFKVKGTKIDIDASKYDVADIKNGVYKNFDGSVDIDLLNNKYIDTKNGIFIDPENKISAIMNNGKLENIIIPNISFSGSSMSGDSGPCGPRVSTRSEFIRINHTTPEEYYKNEKPRFDRIIPDDNRTTFQKICDFFTGKNSIYDGKSYDFYGREIICLKNEKGGWSHVLVNDSIRDLSKKYDLSNQSIEELSKTLSDLKLQAYIVDHYPQYSSFITPKFDSMDKFLESCQNNHSNSADSIDTETDAPDVNIDDAGDHIDDFII